MEKMAEKNPIILETECPKCGFVPLHSRKTDYGNHFMVTYKCALCENEFYQKYPKVNRPCCG